MKIGSHLIDPPIILAPMAGVTDLPFRKLCRALGAGLAVSEMITSEPRLRDTNKTRLRSDHSGEIGPISVQIAGSDPTIMADTARFNAEQGADIIDINMGCPAKKVCKVAAGSALLKDELLVQAILKAVVDAVNIPVTLKIRTGWDHASKNAIRIAKIAEDCGIAALTIHGRTRADGFKGHAEYDTIRLVKKNIQIPVIANGDITSFEKALFVKEYTQADALMIGRGAMGNPWIFQEINQKQSTASFLEATEINKTLTKHIKSLYEFYGAIKGVMIARKHLLWYLDRYLPRGLWSDNLLKITEPDLQLQHVKSILLQLNQNMPSLDQKP